MDSIFTAKLTETGWKIDIGERSVHAADQETITRLTTEYLGCKPEEIGKTYSFVWDGIIKIDKVVEYSKVEYGKGIGDFGRSRGPSYGNQTVAKLAQFEDLI